MRQRRLAGLCVASTATLIDNITRLGLDFDRYVTVHTPAPDRPLTRADLVGAVRNAGPER